VALLLVASSRASSSAGSWPSPLSIFASARQTGCQISVRR
jgi:hypothetical protein